MRFDILIIQSDPLEAAVTAERFHAYGCNIAGIGHSGEDALAMARQLRPDVLVMDAFLPGYNCEEITEILEQNPKFPLVKLALSCCKNDLMADRFLNSGGDLFLMTPLDYSFCMKRIEKFYRLRSNQSTSILPDVQVRGCAKKMLMRMQMPMTIHGFVYTLDAVELIIQNPALLHDIVHGLYASIGRIRAQRCSNIERCIRTAVEKTFELGDMDFLFPLYSHVIKPLSGKPTNGDFISILAALVAAELGLETARQP